ncbi:MAG TPA: TolC family protein [Bdellovibrio sp.]|uniref:TolC family protein n=1 Tax=Bdellovibrio sp. TaxID=28201 RepID=UPI002F1A17A8
MKAKQSLIIGILFLAGFDLKAETLSFSEVWQKISASSPAQQGAKLKTESVDAGLSRAQLHWLPRIYLDARTYRTNDPGNAFLGLLEQRKVENADFSPDSLNHPDDQLFTRGAIGLDLALYEGGMKDAQVEMYKRLSTSEKLAATQIEIDQYAGSGLAYGSIVSIQKQKQKLSELNNEMTKLMKGYQLGQKSNPVGYSGLLGMKSLANRISGLIEQLEAQEKSYYAALKEMGVQDLNWSPTAIEVKNFVDQYFAEKSENVAIQSYKSQAQLQQALANLEASKMEKARYLPRVGAFAESSIFNGSRDTSNAYTAGLYLQWSLLDPSDFGKYKEATLGAQAARKFTEASVQQENAVREGLSENDKALRSNLTRLEESDKLLSEQTKVSSQLFKNGSINALQFVEILNRRTDLIMQQSEAEIGLLKVASERIQKAKFEIPSVAIGGGQK